jgi:hypothetical protein
MDSPPGILAQMDIITNMAMVTDMVMARVRLNPHPAGGENYFDS